MEPVQIHQREIKEAFGAMGSQIDLCRDYEAARSEPNSRYYLLLLWRLEKEVRANGPIRSGGWVYGWSQGDQSLYRRKASR